MRGEPDYDDFPPCGCACLCDRPVTGEWLITSRDQETHQVFLCDPCEQAVRESDDTVSIREVLGDDEYREMVEARRL